MKLMIRGVQRESLWFQLTVQGRNKNNHILLCIIALLGIAQNTEIII